MEVEVEGVAVVAVDAVAAVDDIVEASSMAAGVGIPTRTTRIRTMGTPTATAMGATGAITGRTASWEA